MLDLMGGLLLHSDDGSWLRFDMACVRVLRLNDCFFFLLKCRKSIFFSQFDFDAHTVETRPISYLCDVYMKRKLRFICSRIIDSFLKAQQSLREFLGLLPGCFL